MQDRNFVFTMTTGRSGTAYLAALLSQNLPGGEIHHEFFGWDQFGLNMPEISHMTLFNTQGNVEKIQVFWRQKLARIATKPQRFYVETSHQLMKVGLIENLATLSKIGRVHLINLQRDPVATVKSFRARGDFTDKTNLWYWYLDPQYPKNMTSSAELARFGINGVCVWYINEIRLRAAYYEKLLAGNPNVAVHHVTLDEIGQPKGAARLLQALGAAKPPSELIIPAAQNITHRKVTWAPADEDRLRKLVSAAEFDAAPLAGAAMKRGFGF